MNPAGVLIFLVVTLCAAQKQKTSQKPEGDFRNEAERVNSRGCSNLTLVLDNWKYAIMTQVKDLLLHDHNTVLPDYGRIQPLSDALGDLYKEFNTLKERLSELTSKFDGVESFVDEARSGRKPAAPRGEPRPPGSPPGEARKKPEVEIQSLKKPS
uniref:Si:ch73-127m5.3 n=1 Tax=Labrus bergylta TaxID=56723 RepID=A0A3Q3LNE4_9LABR